VTGYATRWIRRPGNPAGVAYTQDNRRHLTAMRRRSTIAVTAVAAMAALVISACSSSGTSSPSTGNSSGSGGGAGAGAAPAFTAGLSSIVNPSTHKGGTLTFDDSNTPDSFDGGNTYYAWVLNFTHLYELPLFVYKSCPGTCGLQLVPGLASDMGTASA